MINKMCFSSIKNNKHDFYCTAVKYCYILSLNVTNEDTEAYKPGAYKTAGT